MAEENNINTRGFAMQYGTFVGIAWIICFACFIGMMSYPVFSLLIPWISLISVVMAYTFTCAYKVYVYKKERAFMHLWGFSFQTFLYASLLAAAAHIVYYAYLDHGNVLRFLSSDETREMMKAYMSEADVNLTIKTFASMAPIDVTIQMLTTNITIGFFLSIIVAALSSRKKVKAI